MKTMKKNLSAKDVFSISSVIPVVVIEEIEQAIPLAKALLAGGVQVMEITLRSSCALDAIRAVRAEVPEILVGAGTVMSAEQLRACVVAGAQFAIAPGLTSNLLKAAEALDIVFIPGVVTMSEVQLALEHGYDHLKFFPAQAMGGVATLKSYQGPAPEVMFCATGGISSENAQDYLALKNVLCVGGSWIVPQSCLAEQDWQGVTALCQAL